MPIFFYNTLSRRVEEFIPIKPGHAGLYTCGPTVYNYAHIGNLRTYVFEDILKRVLVFNNFKVKHVMNITDVGHLTSDADEGEDKMEKGARREGKTAWEIAAFFTEAFKSDITALNILPANILSLVTANIPEQIELIKKLETKGFTYRTADGIYFDTARLPDYGKLARLKIDDLKAGARVEMGDKKNITDFALWKFSPAGEKRQMEWNSPWGVGFPGWHLECSAIAAKYLGETFDIHCGGIDHIPVHHTNEIAQSEAANGVPLAHYWMHGEFLLTGDAKMAKSGDNFLTLQSIVDKGLSPLAYRYFLLQAHYRKQLNFTWEALAAAQTGLERMYHSISSLPTTVIPSERSDEESLSNQFTELINDDLNIPGALALVWSAINKKIISQYTLFKFDEVLGLGIKEQGVRSKEKIIAVIPDDIKKLAAERDTARQNGEWAKSDELRQRLEGLGYRVIDDKTGTRLEKLIG